MFILYNPSYNILFWSRRYILEVVFDRTSGKILGAFAIGKQDIARRVDMIATAIYGGMCVDDLAYVDYCYAPPFGTPKDIVNVAGYVAGNVIRNEVQLCESSRM